MPTEKAQQRRETCASFYAEMDTEQTRRTLAERLFDMAYTEWLELPEDSPHKVALYNEFMSLAAYRDSLPNFKALMK